jgi:menaquinone-dependent protoporphyrinogen IX oxidase
MSRVLILYATVEGQTARIAERISQRLRDKGHMVGNDTDTARDCEYTDWDAVARFADAFAQQLQRT